MPLRAIGLRVRKPIIQWHQSGTIANEQGIVWFMLVAYYSRNPLCTWESICIYSHIMPYLCLLLHPSEPLSFFWCSRFMVTSRDRCQRPRRLPAPPRQLELNKWRFVSTSWLHLAKAQKEGKQKPFGKVGAFFFGRQCSIILCWFLWGSNILSHYTYLGQSRSTQYHFKHSLNGLFVHIQILSIK